MSWTSGPAPEAVTLFLLYLDSQRGYSPATAAAYERDLEGLHLFLARRNKGLHDPAEVNRAGYFFLPKFFDIQIFVIENLLPGRSRGW